MKISLIKVLFLFTLYPKLGKNYLRKHFFFFFRFHISLSVEGNIETSVRSEVHNLEGLLDQLEIALQVHYCVSTPRMSWKMTNIRDGLS